MSEGLCPGVIAKAIKAFKRFLTGHPLRLQVTSKLVLMHCTKHGMRAKDT